MTDPSRDQDRAEQSGVPRWVKVSAIVAAVVVAVLLLVMALVGGEHGPGRHMSSGLGEYSSAGAGASTGIGPTWIGPTGVRA